MVNLHMRLILNCFCNNSVLLSVKSSKYKGVPRLIFVTSKVKFVKTR